MITKYNFEIPNNVINSNYQRLINQIWKLIPMKESQEDWVSHLNIVIEEIAGLNKILANDKNFIILLSKLEGLSAPVCEDFMIYRKTVFRCIELLSRMKQ